jgi:hypothetical protein
MDFNQNFNQNQNFIGNYQNQNMQNYNQGFTNQNQNFIIKDDTKPAVTEAEGEVIEVVEEIRNNEVFQDNYEDIEMESDNDEPDNILDLNDIE